MMCHCLHLLLKPKLLICSVSVSELIKSVVNTTHSHSIPVTAERTWVDPSRILDDFPTNDAVNLSWERRIALIRAYFIGVWRRLLAKSINDILISAQVSSESRPEARMIWACVQRRMISWISVIFWFQCLNHPWLCFPKIVCVSGHMDMPVSALLSIADSFFRQIWNSWPVLNM